MKQLTWFYTWRSLYPIIQQLGMLSEHATCTTEYGIGPHAIDHSLHIQGVHDSYPMSLYYYNPSNIALWEKRV